jgi:TRAP-type mannitol/chloroaromatic compound transport system permease small subunit
MPTRASTRSRPIVRCGRGAWIELIGCVVFALPYAGVVAWYGLGFVATSYATGEGSEAVIGIPQRWVIKFLFVFGLWLLVAAIVSVLLRLIVFLFGGPLSASARMNIERVVDPI